MPTSEASATIAAWAESRPDIVALVQIGSRAQPHGGDQWSDYDYQLITIRPGAYSRPAAFSTLGDAWVVALQPVFGGAIKATLIFPGAIEVDLVILSAIEVRLAFAALRAPRLEPLWPAPLRHGIRDLRIVACPGWRIIKGGPSWQARYARLGTTIPWPALTAEQLQARCAEFWAAAIWITKKTARGELHAAQREFHRSLAENLWRLLEHEARLGLRPARPEARHAEAWLPPDRFAQLDLATTPEPAALRRAVQRTARLFDEVATNLARHYQWPAPNHRAASDWINRS